MRSPEAPLRVKILDFDAARAVHPGVRRRRRVVAALLVVPLAVGVLRVVPGVRGRVEHLPTRLSDTAYWQLVSALSEPGGSFISDNYVSNESTFQRVIPDLGQRTRPGGVYLGVGPDQNFTYIAAIEPRMAFIVDIRRQNLLLHLMYKALIELSRDRVEFLSRLFSRPVPALVDRTAAARVLLDALAGAAPDEEWFRRNIEGVRDHLVRRHGFALSSGDVEGITQIYRAFFQAGPDLRYAYPHRWFPTFADLVLETDDRGEPHSYLASDVAFRRVKTLQANNLIVPIVGDFAGAKALRAVGRYLRAHGATVSVFYTSNVEFYLFEDARWKDFAANVASLPIDDSSVFIRAYFAGPRSQAGSRSKTELEPIGNALAASHQGRIGSYADVIHH
jgi:hypothetical protein